MKKKNSPTIKDLEKIQEYERYFDGAKFIHFMLGPATVALAIPIYKQFRVIQKRRR